MSTTSETWIWYENPITQTVLGWLGGDLSLPAGICMYAAAAALSGSVFFALNCRKPLAPMLAGGAVAIVIGLVPVIFRTAIEAGAVIAASDSRTAALPSEEMIGHTSASIAVSWLLITIAFWHFAVALTAGVTAARSRGLTQPAHPHVIVSAPAGQGKQRALQLVRQLDEHQSDPDVHHEGDRR